MAVPWKLVLLWAIVAPMLVFGLADDVVDLLHEHPPIPDRLLMPFNLFRDWQRGHPGLAVLPAWIDAATSFLLAASGVGFLLGSRHRSAFFPAALIVGLGVLDETHSVPLPEVVISGYWYAYWPVLMAAMVRFSSQFPARLDASAIGPVVPSRSGQPSMVDRAGRLLRLAGRGVLRLLLRPALPWAIALAVASARGLVLDLSGNPRPGVNHVSLLSGGIPFLVVLVAFPLVSLRLFVEGYRRATPTLRRRALWIVQACNIYLSGFVLLTVVSLAGALLGLLEEPIVFLLIGLLYLAVVLLVALFLLVAIYYDGAVNPALVIRKTFLLTMLSAAGIFVYSVVETLVSDTVLALFDAPRSMVAEAIGAAVVALILVPIAGKLSRVVEPLTCALTRSLKAEKMEPGGSSST